MYRLHLNYNKLIITQCLEVQFHIKDFAMLVNTMQQGHIESKNVGI